MPDDDEQLPQLTLVIPAFNDEPFSTHKIEDTLAQQHPADKLEVVVADDGSTDWTAAIAQDERVRVIGRPDRARKGDTINRAVPLANGEICPHRLERLVRPSALRAVAAAFSDPEVGTSVSQKRTWRRTSRGDWPAGSRARP
jgi:cellulose synthase/poly-beta-1,6-N-acetylglucosamine synthase-like glycosyltransferase